MCWVVRWLECACAAPPCFQLSHFSRRRNNPLNLNIVWASWTHSSGSAVLKVFKINWWWFYDRFECLIHSESIVLVLFVVQVSWIPSFVRCCVMFSVSMQCQCWRGVRCVGVMSPVSKCPRHRVRKYFRLISIKHGVATRVPTCQLTRASRRCHVRHVCRVCSATSPHQSDLSPACPGQQPSQPSPAGFLCPENINHHGQQEQQDKNFHVDFYHLFIGSQNSFYSIFLPETKVVSLKLIKSDFKQNKSWTWHLPHKSGNDWPRKAVIGRVLRFWLWFILEMGRMVYKDP